MNRCGICKKPVRVPDGISRSASILRDGTWNHRACLAAWDKVTAEYQEGYDEGQAGERAAVVAWLRAQNYQGGLSEGVEMIAYLIEHGEHDGTPT